MLVFSNGQLGKGKSSKKAKVEPSREDMHAVVVDILKEVDFNTVSNISVAVYVYLHIWSFQFLLITNNILYLP